MDVEQALTGVGVAEVAALLRADPAAADSGILAGEVALLEALARRVETAIAARVGEADRRMVWAEDGHRGVRGWVQAITNCSPAEATARAKVGRMLRDLPEVATPGYVSMLGVGQVRELARLHCHPRCGDQFADAAPLLMCHAEDLPFVDLLRVCRRWEQLADSDGAHRQCEAAHRGRDARFAVLDAELHVRAHGGHVQGAVIREVWDRFVESEFVADWEECRARHGDAARVDLCERTAAQRRFDALVAVFATAGGGVGAGVGAVVNVIVDEHTFDAALRATVSGTTVASEVEGWAPAALIGRRCELADGTPIDPLDAVAAAFVGHVRRVVLDRAEVMINAGRKRRLFTGLARFAALFGRDRCVWPGCIQHARQVDHLQPHFSQGHTDQANAGPLCGYHNRWRTRGHTPQRDRDGHWSIRRPDGSVLTHEQLATIHLATDGP